MLRCRIRCSNAADMDDWPWLVAPFPADFGNRIEFLHKRCSIARAIRSLRWWLYCTPWFQVFRQVSTNFELSERLDHRGPRPPGNFHPPNGHIEHCLHGEPFHVQLCKDGPENCSKIRVTAKALSGNILLTLESKSNETNLKIFIDHVPHNAKRCLPVLVTPTWLRCVTLLLVVVRSEVFKLHDRFEDELA